MNNYTFHLKLTPIQRNGDRQSEVCILSHEEIWVFIIVEMLEENIFQNNAGKISQRSLVFCYYLTLHYIIIILVIFIILVLIVWFFWWLHPHTIYLIDVLQAFINGRGSFSIIDQVAAFYILTRNCFIFIIRLGSLKSRFINSGTDDISIRYHMTIIHTFKLSNMRFIPIRIPNQRWLIRVIHHLTRFTHFVLVSIEILILASWYCVIVRTGISISVGTLPWLIKVALIVLNLTLDTVGVIVILIIDDDECFLLFLLSVLIFIVKCIIIWIKGIPKPFGVFLLHYLGRFYEFLIIWIVVQQRRWWLSLRCGECIGVGIILGYLDSLIQFLNNIEHLKHGVLSDIILVPTIVVGVGVIVVEEVIGSIVVVIE